MIELILVMALLIIAVAGVAPRLASFFSGRSLDSEAQKFLALTRYGQSQAASEGVPMVLWMDPDTGTYGLRPQEGFDVSSEKAMVPNEDKTGTKARTDLNFRLANKLRFNLDQGVTGAKLPAVIQFAPDGSIGEESLQTVVIQQEGGSQIAIVQADNQLNYVIEQNANVSKTSAR